MRLPRAKISLTSWAMLFLSGSTILQPETPETISLMSPTSVATMGRLQAIASLITLGDPSLIEAKTSTFAAFIKQGIIPIALPEAKAAAKEDVKKEVTVYVNAKGEMFFDKEKVDLKALEEKLSGVSKKQTVVLRSDKESKFQDFVSVMDILKRLGHEQLYIVTKE